MAPRNRSPKRRRSRSRSDRRRRPNDSKITRQRCSSSDEEKKAVPAAAPSTVAKPPKPREVVTVTLATRPFGMAPSKEAAASGYMVEKVAEDKPAAQAGIEQGWTVKQVAGTDCQGMASAAVQALLKDAALPVEVQFEKPESETLPSSEDENDILNVRADQRRGNEAALSNIDDLPVDREPEDLPVPICSWREAVDRKLLNASLVQKLHAAGLKRPTLIQRHAIPIIGHADHWDLVAQAQTGSGKTFAFVIPTIARLVLRGCPARPFFPGPTAQACPVVLVLSPTRELAIQTCTEIEVLTKGTKLSQMSIYGGETIKETAKRVEAAPIDIVCATPGRLIALLDETKLSLAYVQTVILDEADQMLEQRLEIMCADILVGRDMPAPNSGRQTLLFSATIPQKIRDMCPQILRTVRTGHLTIGHYAEDKGGSCESIKQVLRWSPDDKQRIGELIRDLRTYWDRKKGRVVIFSNMRITADSLAHQLQRESMTCRHLHGKLDQEVREKVFDGFRRGEFDILVATNVASRGLDFPDVSLVVQFNLPEDIDVYTHRVGRTGRIGQVGLALAYMGPKDKKIATKLLEFLELNKQEVPDFLRDLSLRVETLRRGR
ncbi:DED1 [Symbiodinium pilosum]|uniref:RNA helicase n=1 Tax=Symbiodinium pilosum TaxID=2952 RepID=A0A812IP57_SYMPI|nr:DED1 [Symbiodinium pilosum]